MWYNRLRPPSISSFDSLMKEFKLNFMVSTRPRPIAASLLGLMQGTTNPLLSSSDDLQPRYGECPMPTPHWRFRHS
ncbi:hypothetical protein BHE74_00005784 [Ensete ventricosum]|nr:hypothetical protein BHE74_00005784 [Ensete ventricosum]